MHIVLHYVPSSLLKFWWSILLLMIKRTKIKFYYESYNFSQPGCVRFSLSYINKLHKQCHELFHFLYHVFYFLIIVAFSYNQCVFLYKYVFVIECPIILFSSLETGSDYLLTHIDVLVYPTYWYAFCNISIIHFSYPQCF